MLPHVSNGCFPVGSGCLPATISESRISRIARSDAPPRMSVWEKIKEFFCSTHKSEALECIRTICHPPAGTTREDVVYRFEQLRAFAYSGFGENIQSGRYGENHFCILDASSREILSVTLDDTGTYTVNCEGYSTVLDLTMGTQQEAVHTEASVTNTPQTAEDYEAVWSAWEREAPPEEAAARATAVQKMRECLDRNLELVLSGLTISSLPDHLPPGLLALDIENIPLTSLPVLPHGLLALDIKNVPLTSLPELPHGLQELSIFAPHLSSLPALPHGLRKLNIWDTRLSSLPMLPHGLQDLSIASILLTSLPALPPGLQKLYIAGVPLTSLPALSPGLRELSILNTPLSNLPELPPELQSLYISRAQLTSLPELTSGLQELTIRNTPLTSLPESIAGLAPETQVVLLGNPLSVAYASGPANHDPYPWLFRPQNILRYGGV